MADGPRDDDTAIRPTPGAAGEGAAGSSEAYQDPCGRPEGGAEE